MKKGYLPGSNGGQSNAGRRSAVRSIAGWGSVCFGVALAVALTCIAQDGRPVATGATAAEIPSQDSTAARGTAQAGNPLTGQQKAATTDIERKKQIADESTKLLAMAVALKAEVDKTNKDMLSVAVIRKADEIEKMAHNVRERMKQGSGPN